MFPTVQAFTSGYPFYLRFFTFPLLALTLLSACTPAPPEPSNAEIAAQLGDTSRLVPLFDALYGLETHKRRAPVVILQIGDSHTANDSFSGRLRDDFQARFGNAGRGVLPPGIPYRYYRPANVSVSSEGWQVQRSYRVGTPGPFGISGLRQHADGEATMTLSTDDPADLAVAEVELLDQPGGGSVDIENETGDHRLVVTGAAEAKPVWIRLPSSTTGHSMTVRAMGDGPVDVLAWRVGRDAPGVVLANLGTIGARVDLLGRWDPDIMRQEFDHLKPTVILLAFGTNEGFDDDTDSATYRATFDASLSDLHQAAPTATIVVLGPPDGARHIRRGRGGDSECGVPGWVEPPQLTTVREVQRVVAAQRRLFFWDWQEAMGGACSMDQWAAEQPPLAARDHVHLFEPGYQATADMLFHNFMAGYERYRALRSGKPAA